MYWKVKGQLNRIFLQRAYAKSSVVSCEYEYEACGSFSITIIF